MAIDTSEFLSVTYGAATFMATGYTWKQEPVVKDGVGRVAAKLTVDIDGWIDDDTTSAFNAKLVALGNLGIDGLALSILGLGGLQEQLLSPAVCEDGGPHATYQILPEADGPLHRKLKFRLAATLFESPNAFFFRTQTRPDGLRTFTQTGEINVPDAGAYFASNILPGLQATFTPTIYSLGYDLTVSGVSNAKATYSVTAVQMASTLPSAGDVSAVSGTASENFEIDEQLRNTTVYTYDLLLKGSGDPTALHESLRPDLEGSQQIIRESKTIRTLPDLRLRSSFTVLSGDAQGQLLEWTETLEHESDDQTYDLKTFIGASPIAVQRPQVVAKATISGRAVGLGAFPIEPSLPTGTLLAEPPRVSYDAQDNFHMVTTWTYVVMDDPNNTGGNGIMAWQPSILARQNTGFYSISQGDGDTSGNSGGGD